MIKGITSIAPVASDDAFAKLTSLLRSLGFEEGKGWTDDGGRGAPFLAPLGNLELVAGRAPAGPSLLIEVTQLDAVYAVVRAWMASNFRTEEAVVRLTSPAPTHWNSRLSPQSSRRGSSWASGSRRTRCVAVRSRSRAISRPRVCASRSWSPAGTP
jgi:6,7-dimethyl-8-ribityllumazine synthase